MGVLTRVEEAATDPFDGASTKVDTSSQADDLSSELEVGEVGDSLEPTTTRGIGLSFRSIR